MTVGLFVTDYDLSFIEAHLSVCGLPILSSVPEGQPYLHGTSRGLAWHDGLGSSPLYIDFLSSAWRHRLRSVGQRCELLARAVGLSKGYRRICDATAGLGSDAMVLAALGAEVTLLERSPEMVLLLADALCRARRGGLLAADRIELHFADAVSYWRANQSLQFEVVYCDPMFPKKAKSALVKAPLRMVRRVVGDDTDAVLLCQAAFTCAEKRVVVKRLRHAPLLADRLVSCQIVGKTNRFDVYCL